MLGFSTSTKERYKLDTMFVESQGMTEVYDSIVGTGEWQVLWNQSDGLNGVPTEDMRQVIDRGVR